MKVTAEKIQNRISDSLSAVKDSSTAGKYFNFAKNDASLSEVHDKAVEAGLLGNFQKIMDSDVAQTFIQSKNYGPYVMEVWPVVTAWYPEFPLKELISVQDMDKPLAYIFLSSLKAANSKAPTVVGARVETPLGVRDIRGNYPTGEVVGEVIPADQIENEDNFSVSLLAYNPLNVSASYLENYKVTVEGGTLAGAYVASGVAGGKIALVKAGTTIATEHYIDIETGAVYFKEDSKTITKLTVNYVWQIEMATDENIPTVVEDIEMIPMEAIPRALALKWTVFSEYLKKSQFKTDVREDVTKRVLNLIYQYQVRYILDQMYDYADPTETVEEIKIPSSTVISLDVKSQLVQEKLKNVANRIEINSGRIEGNRIVCGKNFKSFVESLPSTLFKPEAPNTGFSGPRCIGTYGTFKVYYDNNRKSEEAFMTYRGTDWYDAAYYMGTFMPIVPTDAIAIGTKIREAFCSMEAYKFHKKNCVLKLKFTYE